MFEQYLAISTLEYPGVGGILFSWFFFVVVVIAVKGFLFVMFVCHNYMLQEKK